MEVTEDKKTYRKAVFNDVKIAKQQKRMNNRLLLRLGMIYNLPLGFLSGMYIKHIDDNSCKVAVPYKFLNKNPFKTTYWAVLGMAAEMASGIILVTYSKNITPSVATFVVGCESTFINRALGVTTFECHDGQLIKEKVKLAAETGEGHTFTTKTVGYAEDGKEVAEFIFTWSVKGRSK
ncbi:MAG: DUF4442 domain-containing protein [Chitinophagales bacterium]